jgi:hypothetical protein
MATKMYKEGKILMVRGMDAKARLEDGWTFEPSKKPTPKTRQRYKLKVKDVEVKPILTSPEDNNNEEINNGD